MTREELEDVISEALQDSMDIDWNSSMGAHYVADALEKEGIWSGGPKDVKYSHGPNAESVSLIEDSPSAEPEDDVIEVMAKWLDHEADGWMKNTDAERQLHLAANLLRSLLERERVLREALDRLTQTGNGGDRTNPRIVDLCFTAFLRAKDKNDEDGGPTDWFNDTLPGIEKLIAEVRARTALSNPLKDD